MLRRLPPTAAPLTLADLREGLRRGRSQRQACARFQEALARSLGVRACFLAASGRTALYLLLRGLATAADHPERREVLLPAYTCPALVPVVRQAGLVPRLVDISPETLDFDRTRLEKRIGEQTLAIILVHPFGLPQPVAELAARARAAGAVIVEDAAQALGARLGGQPVGTIGDFGLFSLGPGKPLSTGGGGIVCTNNPAHSELLARAWADLPPPSTAASAWALLRLALSALAFHPAGWSLATRVGLHRVGDHEASWGFARRGLTGAQALVGLALLERLEAANGRRREQARLLIERLQVLDFLHLPRPGSSAEPIYLRLPVLVADESHRERLYHALWAADIGAGRMYRRPLSNIFPRLAQEPYPGAGFVARHLLTLPTHHYLSREDVERIAHICETIR